MKRSLFSTILTLLFIFTTFLSNTFAEVFQNYPNPFNPETWIPYTFFETSNVKLSIFASNGELIREFKLGYQSRGQKRIHWNGKNAADETVASGIYFYQFEAGRTKSVRKCGY